MITLVNSQEVSIMNKYAQELRTTAQAMMVEGKGILEMDESNGTCNQRAQLGIATTEENSHAYRELSLTDSNLSNYTSGAILGVGNWRDEF